MRGAISPFVQKSSESRPTSSKNVSWETLDKLCQVRLFAAEDAPCLSGTALQELFQAKKTGFLHTVIPVSEKDLPPGFVSFAVKRTRLGAESIVAMDAQIRWRCPEKFVYNSMWQVAAGGGSTEASAEHKREARVLEAVYPRSSAPSSPVESQETFADLQDALVPQIPLFSVEDEDEEMEEGFLSGTVALKSSYPFSMDLKLGVGVLPDQNPNEISQEREHWRESGGLYSSSYDSSIMCKSGQPDPGPSASCLKDADPNVAAAAAAAYAVLKAKERGALLDHDLLIKILTNPILIKTLLASNQKLKNQPGDHLRTLLNKETGKGCSHNGSSDLLGRVSNSSQGPNFTTLPVLQGSQTIDSAFEAKDILAVHGTASNQVWDTISHGGNFSGDRPLLAPGTQEQSSGYKEMPWQSKGTLGMGVPPSELLPNRQDILKELIQQHGGEKSKNEPPSKSVTTMELVDIGKPVSDVERHRATGLGSWSESWVGSKQNTSSYHARNDVSLHDRLGGEVPHSRFNKPCIYFNTPKGCRRGISCFYLHDDAAPKKRYFERSTTDVSQFQQAKKPKFGVPDADWTDVSQFQQAKKPKFGVPDAD